MSNDRHGHFKILWYSKTLNFHGEILQSNWGALEHREDICQFVPCPDCTCISSLFHPFVLFPGIPCIRVSLMHIFTGSIKYINHNITSAIALHWCYFSFHKQNIKPILTYIVYHGIWRKFACWCHFPNDIFKCIFLEENVFISITISNFFLRYH